MLTSVEPAFSPDSVIVAVLHQARAANPLARHAAEFRHNLGLGVFPVKDKVPDFKRWQKGGLKSIQSIYKNFGKYEGIYDIECLEDLVMIGVPTGYRLSSGGYLVVLDGDERNGAKEALSKLPRLPDTVTAKTPDGLHYWFWSPTPFPSFTRNDGLEVKCVGTYVVVPPAPGRYWIRSPFMHPIAQAPEWLIARPRQPKPAGKRTYTFVTRCPLTGQSSIMDLGPKGQRHTKLLKIAGSYNRRGKTSPEDRAELTQAALHSGLPLSEADRLISYCFRSTPSPSSHSTYPPAAGAVLNTGVVQKTVRLTAEDDLVLLFALEQFNRNSRRRHLQDKWVNLSDAWKDILSCRYVGKWAKIDQAEASRSLRRLVGAGMLWRSPKLRLLRKGRAYQYRPTYLGVAHAAELGFDPDAERKPLAEEFPGQQGQAVNMEVENERAA